MILIQSASLYIFLFRGHHAQITLSITYHMHYGQSLLAFHGSYSTGPLSFYNYYTLLEYHLVAMLRWLIVRARSNDLKLFLFSQRLRSKLRLSLTRDPPMDTHTPFGLPQRSLERCCQYLYFLRRYAPNRLGTWNITSIHCTFLVPPGGFLCLFLGAVSRSIAALSPQRVEPFVFPGSQPIVGQNPPLPSPCALPWVSSLYLRGGLAVPLVEVNLSFGPGSPTARIYPSDMTRTLRRRSPLPHQQRSILPRVKPSAILPYRVLLSSGNTLLQSPLSFSRGKPLLWRLRDNLIRRGL